MKAIEQRKQMRGQGGFTLIELLVVIAILGVLAGVVVFAVSGINNSSQETACDAEGETVNTAVQAFYAQETAYPTSAGSTTSPPAAKPFIGGLLKKAPTLVTINYGATAADEPTLDWAGKCIALAADGKLDPTP